ncbi:phospholipase A2 inhibitor NAI-like [Erythrolamprus reginae]|uniref:phospholipase A2 inhibitor NAI-like n=1 Tax=Erythrolamprus reginae TaxID=121349 RepID=UPI00396CE72E
MELTSTNTKTAGILVLFVFSSILSTVTSLKCQACIALGSECEEEAVNVVECKENEEFCSTAVVNSTITNPSVNLIVKGCSTPENCLDDLWSITTVDGRFEITRGNCCQTDVCNGEPLLLEHHDTLKPNGLKCPGCYALDEDSCEANQTVNCVGEEDQCFNISYTRLAFGNFTEKSTYQGCTTKKSCFFPVGFSGTADGQIQVNITTLECRNASSSEYGHQ